MKKMVKYSDLKIVFIPPINCSYTIYWFYFILLVLLHSIGGTKIHSQITQISNNFYKQGEFQNNYFCVCPFTEDS